MSSPKAVKAPKARSGRPKKKNGKASTKPFGSSILKDRSPTGTWARYVEAVSLGMNKGDCAAYAGVSDVTVRLWRTIAEDDEQEAHNSDHRDFLADVAKARGELLSKNLRTIEDARTDGDWKAASWLLERLGYHKKTEVEGEIKGTLTYIIDTQDEGA